MQKWEKFFRKEIAEDHRKNTLKPKHLKEFNLNPFLDSYKANFLLGDSSAKLKLDQIQSIKRMSKLVQTTLQGLRIWQEQII